MPITPKFSLSQTDSHVVVDIQVPHVRVSVESVQVVVEDGHVLHFFSHPYLLLLRFPGEFAELADENCASYNPGGSIQLRLLKKEKAYWEHLDLIGNLVGTSKPKTSSWLVESNEGVSGEAPKNEQFVGTSQGYGFASMFSGIFADLDELAREMLASVWEEGQGDHSYREQRRNDRNAKESEDFSEERYLGDLDIEDDYLYQCARQMHPFWHSCKEEDIEGLTNELTTLKVSQSDDISQSAPATMFKPAPLLFSPEETLKLSTIPYPLIPVNLDNNMLLINLADILFAYAYDHLLTCGEPTVESAWTISTLSTSLSWLEEHVSWKLVVSCSLKRMLTYAYIRNFEFGVWVWKQVQSIFQSGLHTVIRCLLQTRDVLHHSESYYLGNKLYIDPYLKWLQARAIDIEPLLEGCASHIDQELQRGDLKESVGLDLGALECRLTGAGLHSSGEEGTDSEETSSGDSSSSSAELTEENSGKPILTPVSTALMDDEIGTSRSRLLVLEDTVTEARVD